MTKLIDLDGLKHYSDQLVTKIDDWKQDKLIPGDNITIDENNVISSTGAAESLHPAILIPDFGDTLSLSNEKIQAGFVQLLNLALKDADGYRLNVLSSYAVSGASSETASDYNSKLNSASVSLYIYDPTSTYARFFISGESYGAKYSSITGKYGIRESGLSTWITYSVYVKKAEFENKHITKVYSSSSFQLSTIKNTGDDYYPLDQTYVDQILATTNTTAFTPTGNYNPATKKYVDDAVAKVTSVSFSKVETLPETGTANIIYLVQDKSAQAPNIYNEYIWIAGSSSYELIGNTQIDIESATDSDIDSLFNEATQENEETVSSE